MCCRICEHTNQTWRWKGRWEESGKRGTDGGREGRMQRFRDGGMKGERDQSISPAPQSSLSMTAHPPPLSKHLLFSQILSPPSDPSSPHSLPPLLSSSIFSCLPSLLLRVPPERLGERARGGESEKERLCVWNRDRLIETDRESSPAKEKDRDWKREG